MAHFVGKVLHIRPLEILTEWSVPELAVAYGEYANEVSQENYNEWKHLDAESRGKIAKPKEYAVEFYGLSKIGE